MSESFVRDAVTEAEGEGAEVARLFPIRGFMNYDPFVLWDHFHVPGDAGFPDHPHRGFEGITYVFEGSMQHADNLGNRTRVDAGGLQRFTAGSGIVHSEMPAQEGSTRGIQMWLNLPKSLKQLEPDYQQVDPDEVVVEKIHNGVIRHLAGEGAALRTRTPLIYLDVHLEPGDWTRTIPAGMRGFVYLVEGDLQVDGVSVEPTQAMFIDASTSDKPLSFDATAASRFMLCFGHPHGEPIRQHGPYVD